MEPKEAAMKKSHLFISFLIAFGCLSTLTFAGIVYDWRQLTSTLGLFGIGLLGLIALIGCKRNVVETSASSMPMKQMVKPNVVNSDRITIKENGGATGHGSAWL
jgi:hypothetical protein